MSTQIEEQAWLDALFPPSRTEAFFDALFGGCEEGAYDIRLICRHNDPARIELAFELIQRPGKCLRCNLTYGLPEVFKRHPVINAAGLAERIASEAGWDQYRWDLGKTHELSDEVHIIPFVLEKL